MIHENLDTILGFHICSQCS